MSKLGLEKAEEPEIKLPAFVGSQRKQGNSRKTPTSASLTMLKPLTVCITTNYGKFLKRWKYQTTWPVFWENCMWLKKQQLELSMEQPTGSKLEKEYIKAIHYHPAYLTSVQSTSFECHAGWITSWNQDCWEKYQQPQIRRWYDADGRKWRETKEPLGEGEIRHWKSWFES